MLTNDSEFDHGNNSKVNTDVHIAGILCGATGTVAGVLCTVWYFFLDPQTLKRRRDGLFTAQDKGFAVMGIVGLILMIAGAFLVPALGPDQTNVKLCFSILGIFAILGWSFYESRYDYYEPEPPTKGASSEQTRSRPMELHVKTVGYSPMELQQSRGPACLKKADYLKRLQRLEEFAMVGPPPAKDLKHQSPGALLKRFEKAESAINKRYLAQRQTALGTYP